MGAVVGSMGVVVGSMEAIVGSMEAIVSSMGIVGRRSLARQRVRLAGSTESWRRGGCSMVVAAAARRLRRLRRLRRQYGGGGNSTAAVAARRRRIGSMVGNLMLEDDSKWLEGLILGAAGRFDGAESRAQERRSVGGGDSDEALTRPLVAKRSE
jgi:hypothetical protein